MLHPVYLLRTEAAGSLSLQALPQRAWLRPQVCVPRRLCLFESVPCKGLAWHERRSFARLQAARLAPFLATGCSAAVRNGTLMLWFWDQAEVLPALAAAGVDAVRVRFMAEPLLLAPPVGSSERRLPCADGVDVQRMSDGAIVTSAWVPGVATGQIEQRRGHAWSWELIGAAALRDGTLPGPRTHHLHQWAWRGALALTVASAVFTSYWAGTVWGFKSQRERLEAAALGTTARLGSLASLQRQASQDKDWVTAYQRLGQGMRWSSFLRALTPSLEKCGVVMKEMEVRQDEIRLAVVTAGAAIDLPLLLESLAAIPGIADVQLRVNVDVTQATFSMRAPGFMNLATVAAR